MDDLGPAVLVVNAASRSGAAGFEAARRHLADLGVRPAGAHAVQDPADLPGIVERAIEAGARLVVLGGGDGTVSRVAALLAGRDVVLGLLPTGTANDLARTLGLPVDLAAACAVVAHGRVVNVDLGIVGEDCFVNVASVGLAAGVTRALSPRLKRRLGPLAYPVAAVRAYRRQRPFAARLEFPDGDHEPVDLADLLQVSVANGRYYGGGNVVAPDAGIDDQLLDVYAIPRGTARRRWQVARKFSSGEFTADEHVPYRRTTAVRLITDPQLTVNVDGELSARTPVRFGVWPAALRVLVEP